MKGRKFDEARRREFTRCGAARGVGDVVMAGELPGDIDSAFLQEFVEVARRAGEASGLTLLGVTIRDEEGRDVLRMG